MLDQSEDFSVSTTDPEGNFVYYQIDWGDGSFSDWSGPQTSGASWTAAHSWSDQGDYLVRVKAKDPFGLETAWSAPLTVEVDCCQGRVGDANASGEDEPTIGDVSAIIDALFITGNVTPIEICVDEADINQSGGDFPFFTDVTIGDVSILIDYLFITGPSLGLGDCL
jgi:hypothetical protein